MYIGMYLMCLVGVVWCMKCVDDVVWGHVDDVFGICTVLFLMYFWCIFCVRDDEYWYIFYLFAMYFMHLLVCLCTFLSSIFTFFPLTYLRRPPIYSKA